jgi:hypothetical protein
MTWASPSSRPRARAGSIFLVLGGGWVYSSAQWEVIQNVPRRASMHATTATFLEFRCCVRYFFSFRMLVIGVSRSVL